MIERRENPADIPAECGKTSSIPLAGEGQKKAMNGLVVVFIQTSNSLLDLGDERQAEILSTRSNFALLPPLRFSLTSANQSVQSDPHRPIGWPDVATVLDIHRRETGQRIPLTASDNCNVGLAK